MQLNTIHNADCLAGLKTLPDNAVDCCVTSPPYYGLRDYGTATWIGGNPDCRHSERKEKGFEKWKQSTNRGNSKPPKGICLKCGAVREDNQIGLEETPEIFITRLVEVFTEIYRVLKPTGTLWLNIGDSYWGGIGGKGTIRPTDRKHEYIKAKDLIGIPWMLAFELRRAGWYLRQDIIWHKPNPMPESVKDRCTKSHEYIFLLTKSANYYFDCEAIKEPQVESSIARGRRNNIRNVTMQNTARYSESAHRNFYTAKILMDDEKRNKRSVWTVCSRPEPESHFATFPQELIVDCIKAGCPENGVVLDPFMGSGTTAVVARKLNRNYIGFELNPKYVEICNRKINKELGIFK